MTPKSYYSRHLALLLALPAFGSAFAGAKTQLQGSVRIDGSSTVYPITEAMAEEFQKVQPGVKVTVGASGTGAGYKKFCAGETDVSDGSRAISKDEITKCNAAGVEFMELPVAYDGLTVVVNPKNTFVTELSFAQLKQIWEPGSKVSTWKDLNPAWPAAKIKLFGPSSEHGTFDYFTEEVVGKAKSSRSDYNAASDTNTLVTGVAGDVNALGYFGYAYYFSAQKKLRAVPIARGDKAAPVAVTAATIENGSYPLARPLFVTVSKKAAGRPEVGAFTTYYLNNVTAVAPSVGYTALPATMMQAAKSKFDLRALGAWQGASH